MKRIDFHCEKNGQEADLRAGTRLFQIVFELTVGLDLTLHYL